jgi:hypothetical protein
MRQVPNYGDTRQLSCCVYCGSSSKGTRDHVPSKVLIDKPFPDNLPVVGACQPCNSSFSRDEEYLACLVDCTLSGSVDPARPQRETVRNILRNRPAIQARLAAAKAENPDGTLFLPEMERVHNVVLKLARGHAAFELNEPQFDDPDSIAAIPLISLGPEQREAFETSPAPAGWPEVGSRAMQRLIEGHDMDAGGWITVQEGRYRFLASTGDGICIRIVLSEYLACEVIWTG